MPRPGAPVTRTSGSQPRSAATASAPVSIAAALPRLRACRTTCAPAAAAKAAGVVGASRRRRRRRCRPRPVCSAAATVAPIRSDSFLAGMMTARSPCGIASDHSAAAGPPVRRVTAGHLDRLIEHGEDRLQAGDLKDLPGRRAGPGQLKLAAPLAGLPVRGQQHVDAGRVAEVDAGHVHDQADRARAPSAAHQLGLQFGRRVQVDLSRHGEDGVIPLRPGRDL